MSLRRARTTRSGPEQLDLNLLIYLEALLEERHVTRAAVRLRTSQPAVSRALARLRDRFDDPLLVRAGQSLQLSERARSLLPRVIDLLREARALSTPQEFDPSTASGSIRLAAPDVVSFMIVPELLRRLAKYSPGLALEVMPWRPEWRAELERGDIDLTIGIPKGDEPQIHTRNLFEQDWAVVLRSKHPVLKKRWTPQLYASLDHVMISLTGRGGSPIDECLTALQLSRRVALRVPCPLLAPLLIGETDLVFTTVRWLALRLAQTADLEVRRPPFSVPRARVPMLWHERAGADPKHRWFREQVLAVVASLDPSTLRWD